MNINLEMVHLQLTWRCNLHCAFCGQKHKKPLNVLSPSEWLELLERIHDYAPGAVLVLWGGEPLLYPYFRDIVLHAKELDFPLELITNGTQIGVHADLLQKYFCRIYLSVDGPERVHDTIRGKGVFAKVKENLEFLGKIKGELIMMSVMTPENLDCFEALPFGLPVDRIILHPLIYLSEEECRGYPKDFAVEWRRNAVAGYEEKLAQTLKKLQGMKFSVPVEFQPHFRGGFCREPYRHLHIGAGGETSFCTDFTEDSLGNVRGHSLQEIFEGEKAEIFRKHGENLFCSHCSWKNTRKEIIQFAKRR
ncbi:MAG: radical SAM protein [Victivallales bacterium]